MGDMLKFFVTFHILRDIPWSNLNRDDTGTPKRTILGGVERGLLSSQSIKRAIRKDYESRVLRIFPDEMMKTPLLETEAPSSGSIRTRHAVEYVTERVKTILTEGGLGSSFDEAKITSDATKVFQKLSGKGEGAVALFSFEELETLAATLADKVRDKTIGEKLDEGAVKELTDKAIPGNRSGALAIAAFGRMFANAQDKNTDASVAVSPAISTHGNLIETDYFIAGEDLPLETAGASAAHLGTALYTSGVFYHSVTIDPEELGVNWTGISSPSAEEHIKQLVQSIIRSLPTGKKNSTAPYTEPTLVIAEKQGYREAYSISKPVSMSPEGGFVDPTLSLFAGQFDVMREVSSNYGSTLVTGMRGEEFAARSEASPASVSEDDLIEAVTGWILKQASAGDHNDESDEDSRTETGN